MSSIKKLLGIAVVTGAAVGGAVYLKKRKEERENGIQSTDLESLKNKKLIKILKEDENGTISVTINTKKIKATTDKAADKILDATASAKESITEFVGEEKIQTAKATIEKVKDVVDSAKIKVADTVENIMETSDEHLDENINDDFLDDELEEF